MLSCYHTFVIILLGALVTLGATDVSPSFNPVRVYQNRVGEHTTSVAAAPGIDAKCNPNIFFITDSATECLALSNKTGSIVGPRSCDPSLVGATILACGGSYCHVLNPSQGFIVAISTSTGAVVTTYGSGSVVTPAAIAVSTDSTPKVFVLDASDKSLWYFTFSSSSLATATVTATKLATLSSSGAPVGIAFASSTIWTASAGDTTVQIYNFNATTKTATLTTPHNYTFGSIQSFHMDFYLRAFVNDGTNLLVIGADGLWKKTITGITDVKYVSSTKTNIFVVDGEGLLSLEEKLTFLSQTQGNNVCFNSTTNSPAGSVTVAVTGGTFPINFQSSPMEKNYYDSNANIWVNTTVTTFRGMDVLTQYYSWYIFGDRVSEVLAPSYTKATVAVNATAYVMDGNYSMSVQFASTSGGKIEYRCYQSGDGGFTGGECFQKYMIEALEFYFNPGLGGQTIAIRGWDQAEMDDPEDLFIINPNQYEAGQWHKISFPLKRAKYSFLYIADASPQATPNTFYIDAFRTVPYNTSGVRYVTVKDACGATVTAPSFTVTPYTFTATISATPVTCNAALNPVNASTASDGVATVLTNGGTAPFTYNWGIPGFSNSSIPNLPSFHTSISVYDNALNSSWVDSSVIPRNMADTEKYWSAPYSFSMEPAAGSDSKMIQFTTTSPIQAIAGSTLSFYVNGGPRGGQRIKLLIMKYTTILTGGNENLLNLMMGRINIPPNVWLKLTYRFSSPTLFTSVGFQLVSSQAESKIYFDDMVFTYAPVLTVQDATGCQSVVPALDIPTPAPLEVIVTSFNVKCFNQSDGSLRLNASGGIPPYTYTSSVGSKVVRDLFTYPFILPNWGENQVLLNVTDSNGCTTSGMVANILQPPPLQLTLTKAPIQCKGGSATLTSTISGGVGPYTYTWTSTSPISIAPQPLPVLIFDDALSVTVSASPNTKVVCLGTGTHEALTYPPTHSGYCSLVPTFSTASPVAQLSACSTCTAAVEKYSGLEFWMFVEKAEDAQNLVLSLSEKSVTVVAPTPIASLGTIVPGTWNRVFAPIAPASFPDQINITSTNPDLMGKVMIDDIVWIPEKASSVGVAVHTGFSSVITVSSGVYFLTVVDANGCSFAQKIAVDEPLALSITSNVQNASSAVTSDGSATVNATGGTPPYTYLWLETNTTGDTHTDLAYGSHAIRVTDANGCVFETSVNIPLSVGVMKVRKYNSGLSAGLAAVVAVGMTVALFGMFMLIRFWVTYSKLGSFFSLALNVGVLLSYVAVITLLPRPTDRLCTAFPWLLGIAFTLVYGCLFIKTWALYQVWIKAIHYQKAHLTPMYIAKALMLGLAVELTLLIVWTVIDPPRVVLVKVVNDTLEHQCDTKHPTFWIIFLSIKGAWLIFGAVLSILTRNVMKEYNESTAIAYAIYNILVLALIGVPLGILLKEVPGGRLVIEIIVPVLAFTSTMVIMFFKLWHNALFQPLPDIKMNSAETATGRNTSAPSSRSGSGGTTTANFSINEADSASVASKAAVEVERI